MTSAQLIEHIEHLIKQTDPESGIGVHAEATEFLRTYAGPRSSFHERLKSTVRFGVCLLLQELIRTHLELVGAGGEGRLIVQVLARMISTESYDLVAAASILVIYRSEG